MPSSHPPMPLLDTASSSYVSIRLAEPVVFIRNDVASSSQRESNTRTGTSIVRGLLTVHFVKPTRVTSIDVDLSAKTSNAWPEDVGSRRVDVTEEHEVFSASTTYFQAGVPTRRHVSLGPGILPHEDDTEWDHSGPSRGYSLDDHSQPAPVRSVRRFSSSGPSPAAVAPSVSLAPPRIAEPSPPYTPIDGDIPRHRPVLSPISTSVGTNAPETPASALQDFRSALLDHRNATPSHVLGLSPSSPSRHREAPRRPSMEDVPEDDQPQFNPPSTPSSTHSHDLLSLAHGQGVHPHSHSHGRPPSPVLERGRKARRFSFASAFLDAVRSRSPKHKEDQQRGRGYSKQRDASRGSNASGSRNRSPEGVVPHSATRSTFSRISDMLKLDGDHLSSQHHHLASDRGRQLPEHSSSESGEKWKLFKKGTYTFPISFAIPAGSPPTLRCPYGSVTWELKASVHRPGAFKSKLTAARNLTVVAYPPEDTTEETENIIVERQWTDQLQYMIAISGKSFYIGGTIPVSFSFMPMAKMKVHRLSVLLEEKIEYHTKMKRVARTAPVSRTLLLSLKNDDGTPILPLQSSDITRSPLSAVSPPTQSMSHSELAASFMGPGPWTFHHELELSASCRELHYSNRNRGSNVTVSHMLKIVMRVERGDDLMCDEGTGKRKLFDIVVQAPVHILSCRCNPKWTTLPRYTEHFSDELDASGDGCPCQQETPNSTSTTTRPTVHRVSSADSASSVETTNATPDPSLGPSSTLRSALLAQNTQFERLVSGMESEFGEAPPSYESATVARREVVVAC